MNLRSLTGREAFDRRQQPRAETVPSQERRLLFPRNGQGRLGTSLPHFPGCVPRGADRRGAAPTPRTTSWGRPPIAAPTTFTASASLTSATPAPTARNPFPSGSRPRRTSSSSSAPRATNVICPSYTLELFGLPCPPPTLHIAKDSAPSKVLLQWSTAHPGFRLETTNALSGPAPIGFTGVATVPVVISGKYTITNTPVPPKQFFRLAR